MCVCLDIGLFIGGSWRNFEGRAKLQALGVLYTVYGPRRSTLYGIPFIRPSVMNMCQTGCFLKTKNAVYFQWYRISFSRARISRRLLH